MNMIFCTVIFQVFCFLFRNTSLKQHIWVAASVYVNRDVLQGSTCFLEKCCSRDYLNVKPPQSKLFQGEYLFTYLLANRYWGSGCFQVNNYCGVFFSGEYLFAVTSSHFSLLFIRSRLSDKISSKLIKSFLKRFVQSCWSETIWETGISSGIRK